MKILIKNYILKYKLNYKLSIIEKIVHTNLYFFVDLYTYSKYYLLKHKNVNFLSSTYSKNKLKIIKKKCSVFM